MAIDPSISMGYRFPDVQVNIPQPVQQLGQILTLRHLMQQGQMGDISLQQQMLALEQARRAAQQQKALNDFLTQRLGGTAGTATPPPAMLAPPQTPDAGTAVTPLVPVQTPEDRTFAPLTGYNPLQNAPLGTPAPAPPVTPAPSLAAPPAAAGPSSMPPAAGFQGFSVDDLRDIATRFGTPGAQFVEAHTKALTDAWKAEHEKSVAQFDQWGEIARTVQGFVDEPSKNAGILQAAKKGWINQDQARELMKMPWNDPRWQGLIKQSLDSKEYLSNQIAQTKEERDKAEELRKATLAPSQLTESQQKAAQETTKAEQAALAQFAQNTPLIGNQQQWDAELAQLPKNVRDRIPKIYSPTAVELVQQAGLTQEQREQLRIQQQNLRLRQTQADPYGLFGTATGGAATPTGPTAAAGGPSSFAQAIADFEGFNKAGSIAQRNNNPGNLRSGPGMTGLDAKGYAIFPDLKTGWAALQGLINGHQGQDLTLQEFIGGKPGVYKGYAPAGDNNDPANYAATVAQKLGTQPDAKLDDIISASAAAPQGRAGISADLTGQALLDALPKALAVRIKAISEGREKPPSGFAAKSPQAQQMMSLVEQYDPTFDAANPAKRASTAIDFASGKSAQQVNALNTVIGHLDSLSQAADKLHNTGFNFYNTVKNWMAAGTGDPDITKFQAVKKAVVDELTRVWRGSGGSEGDIKSWSEVIDSSNSPAQLHGAIQQIGHLLESKLTSLEDQYQQGMGTIGQGRRMLAPGSRTTLDRLEQRANGQTPAGYTITLKSGRTATFPTQDALEAAKRQLGIQ